MKLLTFRAGGESARRLGVLLDGGRVADLSQAGALPFDASDMLSLIGAGIEGLAAVSEALRANRAPLLPLDGLTLMAPIPRPPKNVICVGWNYLPHFEEGAKLRNTQQELPEYPVFFTKAASAVNGPLDPIPWDDAACERLDWEVELGVVIGRPGRNIAPEAAFDHVFGYTVINDVSARDLQRRHGGQWYKGKSLDGACPMGPVLVTADELDPAALGIRSRVNGVSKQDSNTRHMYFKIPRILQELSLGTTLEVGDVIATGTPEGVGFARNPPEFLRPGDVVECEIEGIGCLRNTIGGAAP